MYFDRDGKPISSDKWAELFLKWDYRRVEETYIVIEGSENVPKIHVTTLWVGLSEGYPDPEEMVFVTTIFGWHNMRSTEGEKYTNEKDAKEGHESIVNYILGTVKGSKQMGTYIHPD